MTLIIIATFNAKTSSNTIDIRNVKTVVSYKIQKDLANAIPLAIKYKKQ